MIPQLDSPKAKALAKRVKEKYEYDHSPSSAGFGYDGFNSFIKAA
jgi:hypothetical protein